MVQTDTDDLLAFFKALANESRLRIVGLIAAREHTGRELADLLDLKEPTVSHHLAVLHGVGLVTRRTEGATQWHALVPERLHAFSRALSASADQAAPAPARSTYEERVMDAFVTADGALKVIPASRRKRAVILAWLTEDFEADRTYTEAEVNEALKLRHPDCATLRREMIGHGMMDRRDGVYQRQPPEAWSLG
jgi:DNA-binding transcriptional ArsR family regulator